MKTRAFQFLGFLLLLLSQPAAAQQLSSELQKVREAYLKSDKLSVDVKATVYSSKADVTGTLLGKGIIRKDGKKYYSKFGQDELISNERGTLLIDHDLKELTFFEKPPRKAERNKELGIPSVDTLFAISDSVRARGIKDGLKMFSFYDKTQAAVQTDIYVHPSTNHVVKIVYWYNDMLKEQYGAYKMVIEYSNYSFSNPDPSFFSEKKYISITKGKPAANAAYKHYYLEFVKNEEL